MQLTSARDIIQAIGLHRVARITRRKPVTVSAWQTRVGEIPAMFYPAVAAELRSMGHEDPLPPKAFGMVEHPNRELRFQLD